MDNPWLKLRDAEPFLLDGEREQIGRFNALNAGSPDLQVQTQLLPEPFFGDPDAAVYALCLNPGYSPGDDSWHRNVGFVNAIRQSHAHERRDRPHYYLDPGFADSPGARWWRRKCRWLIDDCGIEALSRNLFCVELFPYHSRKYKPLPRTLSPNGLPESSDYAAHLVADAIRGGKLIVQMRSATRWSSLVPQLRSHERVCRLANPRNVALSPRNLDRYSEVVAAIRRRG
ncbi:hypothetical protein [Alienimonas californiensis]|uniref:hypothetical protein n=1 Tax=Alienimonas californiensis TaxID=2527989 RepID=UPI0011A2A55C|nr:hypothetical protein [Alienimonas californiensis]